MPVDCHQDDGTHISHPFPFFLSHFRRAPSRGRSGSYIPTLSCPITHGCSIAFSLITTSCKLRGPFLPLRGEPHGFGFPAGRTSDDHQAPGLEGLQTRTDVALVPWQGAHQILMTARDHAAGALVVRRYPLEDPFVPS